MKCHKKYSQSMTLSTYGWKKIQKNFGAKIEKRQLLNPFNPFISRTSYNKKYMNRKAQPLSVCMSQQNFRSSLLKKAKNSRTKVTFSTKMEKAQLTGRKWKNWELLLDFITLAILYQKMKAPEQLGPPQWPIEKRPFFDFLKKAAPRSNWNLAKWRKAYLRMVLRNKCAKNEKNSSTRFAVIHQTFFRLRSLL